jgi:hypothetical protein
MFRSKSGWAAIGLGGTSALDGLQQANDYASEVSMAKFNFDQLNVADVLSWTMGHPLVLLPVVALAAAIFVWLDHRKYKRMLFQATTSR